MEGDQNSTCASPRSGQCEVLTQGFGCFQGGLRGVWVDTDRKTRPDIVVYYVHGGAFTMGSTYFYLEFLLALVAHLKDAGFKNPALFSLEYTLVPKAVHPTQLKEAIAGYQHVLTAVDRQKVCVAGDSAGGTLILSMLLYISGRNPSQTPGLALLLSPWTVLVQESRNCTHDYLDNQRLHKFARMYAGKAAVDDPIVSPGRCTDISWWRSAMPTKGLVCAYGTEELFYDEICTLLETLDQVGNVTRIEEETMHVWPVAVLFLGTEVRERHRPLKTIACRIYEQMKN